MRLLSLAILFVAGSLAFADDKKGNAPIRVACVGDSITFGAGVENRDVNNYPKVLGNLLGDSYEVKNFGVSGATLLSKGDKPYVKEKAFTDAKKFNPNIVIIKLGTNDSKPQNWKLEANFVADYKAFVKEFQSLEAKPQVYVCLPVPAYKGNFGITEPVVKDKVKPKIEEVAKSLDLPVIDLYTALSDKPDLFPDQIHPNAAGAKLIAVTVQKAITTKK
ncbi:GDSL-type esterase/lipase family protein [Zavarzinella formosa]|uniref:GDSL-type esterase/lipase family protein n=1 Tax=Zavarzinella formosa TaxID=360055 RepID=UPI0002E00DD2|nr:GDSL-type esterase/lipase family protein [Zavarzinella formosa]